MYYPKQRRRPLYKVSFIPILMLFLTSLALCQNEKQADDHHENGITQEEATDLERREAGPQISLQVIGPDEIYPGVLIVYTIEYSSIGRGTAKDIRILNTFSDGSVVELNVGHATPGWTGKVQMVFMPPPSAMVGTVLESRFEVKFKSLNDEELTPVSTTKKTTLVKSQNQ